jgi:hypothetical protein
LFYVIDAPVSFAARRPSSLLSGEAPYAARIKTPKKKKKMREKENTEKKKKIHREKEKNSSASDAEEIIGTAVINTHTACRNS